MCRVQFMNKRADAPQRFTEEDERTMKEVAALSFVPMDRMLNFRVPPGGAYSFKKMDVDEAAA